jgi:hypothetical protein
MRRGISTNKATTKTKNKRKCRKRTLKIVGGDDTAEMLANIDKIIQCYYKKHCDPVDSQVALTNIHIILQKRVVNQTVEKINIESNTMDPFRSALTYIANDNYVTISRDMANRILNKLSDNFNAIPSSEHSYNRDTLPEVVTPDNDSSDEDNDSSSENHDSRVEDNDENRDNDSSSDNRDSSDEDNDVLYGTSGDSGSNAEQDVTVVTNSEQNDSRTGEKMTVLLNNQERFRELYFMMLDTVDGILKMVIEEDDFNEAIANHKSYDSLKTIETQLKTHNLTYYDLYYCYMHTCGRLIRARHKNSLNQLDRMLRILGYAIDFKKEIDFENDKEYKGTLRDKNIIIANMKKPLKFVIYYDTRINGKRERKWYGRLLKKIENHIEKHQPAGKYATRKKGGRRVKTQTRKNKRS